MHPLLDLRPWPRALLRYPLLILTACLLGAIGAFTYSYAPLHRAKDWRIHYLENRLEIRNAQVHELDKELGVARSSLKSQPSGEEMKALRAQLGEATKLTAAREREIKSLDRKLASMKKSRDSFKRRHASAVADLEAKLSVEPASDPEPALATTSPAPAATGDEPPATADASPATGDAWHATDAAAPDQPVPASPAPVMPSDSGYRIEN